MGNYEHKKLVEDAKCVAIKTGRIEDFNNYFAMDKLFNPESIFAETIEKDNSMEEVYNEDGKTL